MLVINREVKIVHYIKEERELEKSKYKYTYLYEFEYILQKRKNKITGQKNQTKNQLCCWKVGFFSPFLFGSIRARLVIAYLVVARWKGSERLGRGPGPGGVWENEGNEEKK